MSHRFQRVVRFPKRNRTGFHQLSLANASGARPVSGCSPPWKNSQAARRRATVPERLGLHSGFSLSISAFASALAFSMAPFRVMGRPKALSSRERQAYLMPLVKKRPQARVQAPGPQLAPE